MSENLRRRTPYQTKHFVVPTSSRLREVDLLGSGMGFEYWLEKVVNSVTVI